MSENNLLTKEQAIQAFVNTALEENYNFLEEDLVKLANSFANAAKQKIESDIVSKCVGIASSLNKEVAAVLERVVLTPIAEKK